MKILNIYFKNINSLEGESRIHFDQAPMADGGVFAITGPNGSGKSSILDVITLGLYGETYRFDRPADHVMTKWTTESFAQVEFSLGEEQYRSSWQVKRKDDDISGELLAPEMKLVQLNGTEQVLEQTAQQVREKMAELTGMDFHKFSKSMVLAQGDFAAFLNALDSERLDILEKISGTGVYDEYKKQIEETHSQANTQLQMLEQDLSAIPVLDEETREAKEHDLADFKEQLIELEVEQKDIQQQISWVQNLTDLEDQIDSLSNQQEEVENQLEQKQKDIEEIDSMPNLKGIQQEIILFEKKAEESRDSKKTLESYRSELQMLQNQLKSKDLEVNLAPPDISPELQKIKLDEIKLKFSQLKTDLPNENNLLQSLNQQIDEKRSLFNTTSAWLQEHEIDKSLLQNFPETTKLKSIRGELGKLEDQQQIYTEWSKNTNHELAKKQSVIDSLKQTNAEITTQIKEDELDLESLAEGYTLQELQEMKKEQQERIDNFIELNDLSSVYTKMGKKGLFSQILSVNVEQNEEHVLLEEADQLQIEIGLESNIAKTLEQVVSTETLLQKMEAERTHLVDGKPCPLCGAVEHPYATHPPASGIADSKKALQDQQKKVSTLIANADNIKKLIAAVQRQNQKDDIKDNQLQVIKSQWSSLANKLNVSNADLNIDNLSLMKNLLKVERKELDNLSKLIKKYNKQKNSIVNALSDIETNKVKMNRLVNEVESLDKEKNNLPEELISQAKLYGEYEEQEEQLNKTISEQLSKLGEVMPASGQEEVLIERLNIRKQEYQSRFQQQKELTDQIQVLEAKITSSANKITGMTELMEQYKGQVEQEEVASLHLSLVEKQKLIAEKEAILSQQENELTSLENDLAEKTTETGSIDLNVIKEKIALIQNEPELLKNQQVLAEKADKVSNDLVRVTDQLEQEQAKQVTNKPVEQLQDIQKSAREKLEITQQEVKSLQDKLNKQDDLKAKHQDLKAKIENQRQEVESCSADITLVADENSLGFRRKVQQMMIDKLLSQANQILEKISGRYYVRKVESEHGLALEIEDTKQQNVRRLPKTLSGGESFIVSLSLALGLAEMSSDSHAINSLFLDEGFGNLDAESLYLAMTTLESLKTFGKTVGVISHVDGVRKRIKTQIEMIKKPNGLSALKMVS